MIMVRIYQSTPPEFQAILVGGLCPGAEDVAQCEANLPEFWGMIAALLWPGYWDPSVGLAAPFIPSSHSNLALRLSSLDLEVTYRKKVEIGKWKVFKPQ